MTDLAWMKTYIGDEAAITGHLTAEEFGAYERLRRHYWQHGGLPDDEARLTRISSVEPERWASIASAILPLLAEALPRLDQERSDAAVKRERKVAAGRKGAQSRWGTNGTANANANSKTMADAMAEPMRNQWPPAPAPDEVRSGGKVGAYAHAREKIPIFTDRNAAGAWLSALGAFPGDAAFDRCLDKLMEGTATWADVSRAAA